MVMSNNLAPVHADADTDLKNAPEKVLREESASLLEIAGLKKPPKNLYMGLYYAMVLLSLLVIGIGTSVAMISGFAGQLNFSLGTAYFVMAVVLVCLALYFRAKAGNGDER